VFDFPTADGDKESRRSARLVWTEGKKTRKLKFQIQQELGAKPESSYVVKGRVGLTEWLVHTLLLVRAEEYHRAAYPATPTSQRSDQIEVIGQVRPSSLKNGAFDGRREI
jgi:hypothetical protein